MLFEKCMFFEFCLTNLEILNFSNFLKFGNSELLVCDENFKILATGVTVK